MNELYLIKKTTVKEEMADRPPFGPAAPPEIVAKALYMEIWGTRFSTLGPDYTIFRLFDELGVKVWEGRVDGY